MNLLDKDICKKKLYEEVRNLKNPVSISKLFPKTFFYNICFCTEALQVQS